MTQAALYLVYPGQVNSRDGRRKHKKKSGWLASLVEVVTLWTQLGSERALVQHTARRLCWVVLTPCLGADSAVSHSYSKPVSTAGQGQSQRPVKASLNERERGTVNIVLNVHRNHVLLGTGGMEVSK